jgi:serine/threonine protein kinase/Flp pilus assembly protein TadD
VRIGRYEIQEEIARGGMGVVYRARDVEQNQDVALKVLLDRDPEELARFQREAEATRRLRHPNVVSVHGLGLHEGRPYLVMELIEGESLQQRIQRQGSLRTEEAVRVLEGVARAVAAAHAQGILHRDLKPHNVLLEGERVLLADFGVARTRASTLTQTGEVLGTPGYMAPEQAVGERKDWGPLLDVYGLGATLYAALCGRPPFQGASALATLDQVLNGRLLSFKDQGVQVDREIEALCLRCLAREPADRPPAASDVADALEAGILRAPARDRRRGRPAAGGALLLLLLLLLVGGGGFFFSRTVRVDPSPSPSSSLPRSPVDVAPLRAQLEDLVGSWRLQEARALVDRALGVAPQDPVLLANSAWLHALDSKFDDAQRELNRLRLLDPVPSAAALRWAQTLWFYAARAELGLRPSMREEAIRLAESAEPGAEKAGTLALLLIDRRGPGDAQRSKAQAQSEESHPLLSVARVIQIPVHVKNHPMKGWLERKKVLDAALLRSDRHPTLNLELARCDSTFARQASFQRGKEKRADRFSKQSVARAERALELLPRDGIHVTWCGWVYKERGNLLRRQKREPEAVAFYQRALEIMDVAVRLLPDHFVPRRERGWCRLQLVDIRSLDDLERAAAISNKPLLNLRLPAVRTLALKSLERWKGGSALAILKRSPSPVESDPALLIIRARARRMTYDWEGAFEDLRRVEAAPRTPTSSRGVSFLLLPLELAQLQLNKSVFLGLGREALRKPTRRLGLLLGGYAKRRQPPPAQHLLSFVLCSLALDERADAPLRSLVRRGGDVGLFGKALQAAIAQAETPSLDTARAAAEAYLLVLDTRRFSADPFTRGECAKYLQLAADPERGLRVIEAGLLEAPGDPYLLLWRARFHHALGAFSHALADAEASLKQVLSPLGLTTKMSLLARARQFDEAEEAIDLLEKSFPDPERTRQIRANLLRARQAR